MIRIGAVLAGIILLVSAIGIYLSNRIQNQIEELMGKASSYEEIDVDLFRRTIHISSLDYQAGNKRFLAANLSIEGLQYWEYITRKTIVVHFVEVRDPQLILNPDQEKTPAKDKGDLPDFLVKQIQVINGTLMVKDRKSEKNTLFVRVPQVRISELHNKTGKAKNGLPVQFESYRLRADSIALTMNPEHKMSAGSVDIQNGRTQIRNFQIVPQFKREAFDQKIPYEKDRISLKVDQINLDSLQFDFRKDTLRLKNPYMEVSGANLEIYRNKLLPDDPREKSLYGQKIRRSPVKFEFDSVEVQNSQIRYEERLKNDGPPARVRFTDVDGSIGNLMNTNLKRQGYPRTQVQATALFMDRAEVRINWSFDVTNSNEKFRFKGEFGQVEGDDLNPLFKPALGMEASGSLQSVWLTFTGNEEWLEGDVRVEYQRFKLNIMQKGGKKKNKLLTALANLFVDNDGISRRETHSVRVERDVTRSFWNYIWTALKKGVIDTLLQV